jgi:hypothetical protein
VKIFCLIGLLILSGAQAQEVFPHGDLDKITVKNLPACPVIESELIWKDGPEWEKGYRQCVRYAAYAGSPLRLPLLLVHPDWFSPTETTPTQRLLVQLFLDPQGHFPEPKEKGLRVVESPPVTVVCYATRGDYTAEKFVSSLQKVLDHLKQNNLPVIGPPRQALYTTEAWTPRAWWISEVQVPIPSENIQR